MLETREPTRVGVRRFAVTFGLLLASLLVWALAVPMYGAADENQHLVMSYAVVHGEWPARAGPHHSPPFEVPAAFTNVLPCFALNSAKPADCQSIQSRGPMHRVDSTASTYPPLFYVLVGWPTLFTSGLRSLYLVRGVAALWVALMLALALDSLARFARPGPLVLAAAVALSPVVFFFGAAVNPSGLVMASGLAAWTGGFVLLRGRAEPSIGEVARFAGPLCLLLLLRRDSLYWGGLIVLVLAVLAWPDRRRQLVRSREAWGGAAAVAVAALIGTLLGGSDASGVAGQAGTTGSFWNAVSNFPGYLQQLVGVLGWLDTPLPFPTYVAFAVVAAFLVVTTVCFAHPRVALAAVGLCVLVVVVPLAIGTLRYPYFQSRYMVALAVGLPLVAALGITERLESRGWSWPRRPLWVLLPMLGLAQVLGFAQMLRRFSAGTTGDWWIFTTPRWTPPYGSLTALVVAFAIVSAALYVWLYQLARAAPDV